MVISAVMSSKGQVVIPAKLREEMGFKPGARVVFKKRGKGLLIQSASYEAVLALRGKYAGLPLESDLAESRRLDEERLESRYEDVRS